MAEMRVADVQRLGLRRRTVLGGGLACLALPAAAGLAPALHSERVVLILQEGRPSASIFEQNWSRGAARRIEVQGDITATWQSMLDPLWREGGLTTAGITSPAIAFCLEQLAGDHGYRMAYRDADGKHAAAADAPQWVSWLMVPRHLDVQMKWRQS